MKRVAVITMHRVYNYGSILQTYATQRLFEKEGVECEIIDYISPYRAKIPLFFEYPPRLEGKSIKKLFYYIIKIPSFIMKDISFGRFIGKHIQLSAKKYITNRDLLDHPPIADIYVSGSDQVWNSKYNHGIDGSYYLNFVEGGAKKIAFVSSFGHYSITKEEEVQIEPMLKGYYSISVREESAVRILKKMGIDSQWLIDPTLQISRQEWQELASERLIKEEYLLLFLLYNEDNGATEYAKKIAREKSLKIVKLSWELKKPQGVDYLYTHRKPEDFLSLFSNASFIVTNSFHGVAFSINLNRQFIFVPRSEFNDRIDSLLQLVDLMSRKVQCEKELQVSDEIVEYTEVNNILEHEREKAREYLCSVLREEC